MARDAEKPTHDTVMDVSEERVARVYAQAFMEVASKSADPTALIEEFGSFVEDVVAKLPQLRTTLHSALVSQEDKEALLDKALSGRASQPVLNFLKVVSRHGRLTLLATIYRLLQKLDKERRNVTDVEVRLAAPTDDALLAEIENRLRIALGHEPLMHVTIDPELVAGLYVRVGDRVFDGSIRTQLEHIRRAMIESATHGIETTPDRFVTSK
jgi:F-type H+-transporting ATPase subunit delta